MKNLVIGLLRNQTQKTQGRTSWNLKNYNLDVRDSERAQSNIWQDYWTIPNTRCKWWIIAMKQMCTYILCKTVHYN